MFEENETSENLTEEEFMDGLQALLYGEPIENTLLENTSIRTFADAGLLTYDKGLVVTTADGSEFQVTIVQRR